MTTARLLRIVRHRLRSIFRKQAADAELARELAFHLQELAAEYEAAGMPPDEAARAARAALGSVSAVADACREARGLRPLEDVVRDLGYAARALRRSPGFTAVAVASLAIALGANAAILAIVDTALIAPLPFTAADRLVVLRTIDRRAPQAVQNASLADYLAWRAGLQALDAIEASLADQRDFAAAPGGAPAERITGQLVTPGLFALLGVAPVHGRFLTAEDVDGRRPRPVIVLSHRLWARRFGSDPEIVGARVIVNGTELRVVGVMPAAFRYPNDRAEYWVPMQLDGRAPEASSRFYMVLARIRPGSSLDDAQAELDLVARRLAAARPSWHEDWTPRAEPLRHALFGWVWRPLVTLQSASALILLLACANVGCLLLARGFARAPELATRLALGAGRRRIVQQLLTESLLIAALGTAAGVGCAWIAIRSIAGLGLAPPPGQPALDAIHLDAAVLAVTAVLGVLATALFGLLPALVATRSSTAGSRPTMGYGLAVDRGGRMRVWLVVAQISIAVVLSIAAGLLVNSFTRLAFRELNVAADGLLAFEFSIPGPVYASPLPGEPGPPTLAIAAGPRETLRRLHERLRTSPGVLGVGGISYAPINSPIVPVLPATRPAGPAGAQLRADVCYFLTTPGFFATVGTRLVQGREFTDADDRAAPWVAIVNETMARRFWPGEDPIGRRLRLDVVAEEPPREVVGVVADIPLRHTHTEQRPIVYASYLQQPDRYRAPWGGMFGRMFFVARTDGDPWSLAPVLRGAAAAVAPNRPIYNVTPLADALERPMRERHAYVLVIVVFAAAATFLAASGVYGVVAFAAARRRHEIGIRMALGAGRLDVARLIGGGAVRTIGAGIAIGVAAAVLLTRLLASQLWGVAPTDLVTFAAVSATLAAVAATAVVLPVRRALHIDPAAVLKAE